MRALLMFTALAAIAATASAEPVLIATATVSPTLHDKAEQTGGTLENGQSGNLLAGLGSGLAYAGGDRFVSLPDRGPNAKAYDAGVDNTTSFIPRFHTFAMTLKPAGGGALPFTLTPELAATTLLWSATPLGYGSATPTLNTHARFYFSGRSDNFAVAANSLDPANGRFDPEGVRVSADGRSVFVSDEYGPYLYQFDRATGQRLKAFALPEKLAVTKLSPQGDSVEISDNTRGRVANKGMEGLAISPDGKTLFGIMQSPLLQDGGTKAPYVRIIRVDIASGGVHEYAYALDNIGSADKPKYSGVSEIVAVNDHEFLIDERDGKGLGDGSAAGFKRLYHIDLNGAADVAGIEGAGNLAPKAVTKTLFADLVAVLTAKGIAATDISAKIEGLAFGPDVTVAGKAQHTLWVASDNDFGDTPSVFYVLGFNPADLPGYTPQTIATH